MSNIKAVFEQLHLRKRNKDLDARLRSEGRKGDPPQPSKPQNNRGNVGASRGILQTERR